MKPELEQKCDRNYSPQSGYQLSLSTQNCDVLLMQKNQTDTAPQFFFFIIGILFSQIFSLHSHRALESTGPRESC
jgi:hypothetical protein